MKNINLGFQRILGEYIFCSLGGGDSFGFIVSKESWLFTGPGDMIYGSHEDCEYVDAWWLSFEEKRQMQAEMNDSPKHNKKRL